MTATTRKEDYLGRDLANATPGTSDATDHLGRDVVAADKDFLGRDLTSAPHAVSTAYTAGTVVYLATGEELVAETSGTTAGTAPEPPAVGATVVDGGVTWRRTE